MALPTVLAPADVAAGVPWARRSVGVEVKLSGKPRVTGGLDRAAVVDGIGPLLDLTKQCVKRGWEPRAPRKAKMSVKMTIDAKGNATRLKATLGNRLLRRIARCVTTRAGELHFDAPSRPRPTSVRLTIAFEVDTN